MSKDEVKFNKALGLNIRTERRKQRITQEDLAGMLGLSRVQIVNIEQGRSTTSLFNIVKISELFGVTIKRILPSKAQSLDPTLEELYEQVYPTTTP